jgi:hypothetical protein
LRHQDGRVTLTQLDGHAGCFAPVKAYTESGLTEQSKLVFSQYGNSYFLRRVTPAGATGGAELFTSRAERELAKVETRVKQVLVGASGM